MGDRLGRLRSIADERLLLRPWRQADAARLALLLRDPEIPRWTYMARDMDTAAARDWIVRSKRLAAQDRAAIFAIVDRARGQAVGTVGLGNFDWRSAVADVFYWVGAESRRRGFATRAVRMISDWGFTTLSLCRIQLLAHPDNVASHAVAERAGFTYEGTLRSAVVNKGERWDLKLFARLPDASDLPG